MSQIEDIKAIHDMFVRVTPKNSNSAKLKNSWMAWYAKLNNYDKSSTPSVYTEAKKRRDAFFKADEIQPPKAVKPTAASTPIVTPGPRPTLRNGIHKTHPEYKPYISEMQRVVGATPIDGLFGPGTESKVRIWQRAHNLSADGIFGPKSWSAAQLNATQAANAPANITDAAHAASQQVAAIVDQATQAAAANPKKPAQAAAQAAAASVNTAAAQAAHATVSPSPKAYAASLQESVTGALQTVKATTKSAPVWLQAVMGAGGVFAALIAGKAIFGGRK